MNQPQIITVDGVERTLGCLQRTTKVGDGAFRVFGDPGTPGLIGRSLWPALSQVPLDPFVWHVINQSNQGSCMPSAGAGAVMICRENAGLSRVVLSQASVYGQGNGGSDSGMGIDAGLKLIQEVGFCPVDLIDQYDWQGFRRGTWPAGWKDEAAKYRALEAWDCPTYDHAVSAVLRGFPVVLGVFWEGGGGHAIVMIGWNNDVGKPKILNSWGKSWGANGIGYLTEPQCKKGIDYFGAWALRVPTDPTNDGDIPQPH